MAASTYGSSMRVRTKTSRADNWSKWMKTMRESRYFSVSSRGDLEVSERNSDWRGCLKECCLPSIPPSIKNECPSCSRKSAERILINVSGQQFEISSELLDRHPSTLLGNQASRSKFYDKRKKEYFFDRHRPTFEIVFAYFQYGGKLRRPDYIPDDVFLNEIEYYQLEPEVIEDYKISEGYTVENVTFPKNKTLKKIWLAMEYPETSATAYAVAFISVIMTTISIILFCVETLERFAKSHCVADEAPNFLDPFFIIETICTAWFTFEVILGLFYDIHLLEISVTCHHHAENINFMLSKS